MLAAVAIAACIVSAEGVLRIRHYPSAYTAMYEPDALIGYRHVRSTKLTIDEAGRPYELAFDDDGVIDRAGSSPADIVIVGDGVVAGIELPAAARLASRLVSRGCARSAANLSVTGYGPLQEELALERWIARHGAPKCVAVVHNLSNDLVDGVPAWDGEIMTPTIDRTDAFIRPVLPSALHRIAARAAKSLLLYSWYLRRRDVTPDTDMPLQQRWLYEQNPPPDLEEGLRVLESSYRRLAGLAARNRFKVVVVDWVDWDLIAEHDRTAAVARARQRIGAVTPWPLVELSSLTDADGWSARWLVAGARHANPAATDEIARTVCGTCSR